MNSLRIEIRPLQPPDLPAYKALREDMLAAHPEAFTSDAAADRLRDAEAYRPRLGLDRADGGNFLLGAWRGGELVGSLGSERDERVKVRHIAHLIGMMVRPEVRQRGVGWSLLQSCLLALRQANGIAMATLTVTHGNVAAIRLYERAGFVHYGSLPNAICVDGQYHAKDHMLLAL